jgi:predicted enzyme related to lactoylglutathione lyase
MTTNPGSSNDLTGGRPILRGMTTAVFLADDLDAAKRWYSELLGQEPYFNRPPYIEWRFGDYQHELGILDRAYSTAEPAGKPRPGPAGVVLYWHVDNISSAVARLVSMGATVIEPPRDFGEGFIGASLADPFGNILGVMYNPHYLEIVAQKTGGPPTTHD